MANSTTITARTSAGTLNVTWRKPKKIVLIGATKCGKTSLINRFLYNSFTQEYTPTIEDCYHYQYIYQETPWNLDIIDLCAPFMFPVMRDLNIKTAHVILLVYELTNHASIQEIINVSKHVRDIRPEGVTTILVGTKMDIKGPTPWSETTLLQLGESSIKMHMMTSAKMNESVLDIFENCVALLAGNFPDEVFKEQTVSNEKKSAKCCCVVS